MGSLIGFLFLGGWIGGWLLYAKWLRDGVAPRTLRTSLSADEVRELFVARVCRTGWRVVDDGNPMVAQSSLATGIRQQIGLTVRRTDEGDLRVTIEALRLMVKFWTRVPTKGHTLRMRMNGFVAAVQLADPGCRVIAGKAPGAGGRPLPAAAEVAAPVAVAPPAPSAVAPFGARAGLAEEGWYPDPLDADGLRWWSGDAWSEHEHPAEPATRDQQAVSPPPMDSWDPVPPRGFAGASAPAPSAAFAPVGDAAPAALLASGRAFAADGDSWPDGRAVTGVDSPAAGWDAGGGMVAQGSASIGGWVFVLGFGALLLSGSFAPLLSYMGEASGRYASSWGAAPLVVVAIAAVIGGLGGAMGSDTGLGFGGGAVLGFAVVAVPIGDQLIDVFGLGDFDGVSPHVGAFCLLLAMVAAVVALVPSFRSAAAPHLAGRVPIAAGLVAAAGVGLYVFETLAPSYPGADVFAGDWLVDGPRVALVISLVVPALVLLVLRSTSAAAMLCGALAYPVTAWVVQVSLDGGVAASANDRMQIAGIGLAVALAAGALGALHPGLGRADQRDFQADPRQAGVALGVTGLICICGVLLVVLSGRDPANAYFDGGLNADGTSYSVGSDGVVDGGQVSDDASSSDTTVPSLRPVDSSSDADEYLPDFSGSHGCPTIAETRMGSDLALVQRYGTSRFLIWICRDDTGSYVYHGQRRTGDPSTDSLSLAAVRTSTGYKATNSGTTFLIDDSSLRVLNPSGDLIVDDPVRASA